MGNDDATSSCPRPAELAELAAQLRHRCAPALASGALDADEVEQLARNLQSQLDHTEK